MVSVVMYNRKIQLCKTYKGSPTKEEKTKNQNSKTNKDLFFIEFIFAVSQPCTSCSLTNINSNHLKSYVCCFSKHQLVKKYNFYFTNLCALDALIEKVGACEVFQVLGNRCSIVALVDSTFINTYIMQTQLYWLLILIMTFLQRFMLSIKRKVYFDAKIKDPRLDG